MASMIVSMGTGDTISTWVYTDPDRINDVVDQLTDLLGEPDVIQEDPESGQAIDEAIVMVTTNGGS